jgi:AI-2E family transporter
VQLAGAMFRSVSRGVIGIALLQAFLGGAGFLVAGVPAPGVLAFVALLLGILQIGPAILFVPVVIWSWTAMEPMQALLFTAYMVPVGLIDNVLRPFLMARGLATPMPVIMVGVIGGMLAYGILGLFFGPVVLSVAWAVLVAQGAAGDGSSRVCMSRNNLTLGDGLRAWPGTPASVSSSASLRRCGVTFNLDQAGTSTAGASPTSPRRSRRSWTGSEPRRRCSHLFGALASGYAAGGLSWR